MFPTRVRLSKHGEILRRHYCTSWLLVSSDQGMMRDKRSVAIEITNSVNTNCKHITTHFTAMCTPYLFNGVRRSTQAWLENLALFRSISSKKAKKDESI